MLKFVLLTLAWTSAVLCESTGPPPTPLLSSRELRSQRPQTGLLINEKIWALGIFEKVNWYRAMEECASHGMILASINNWREANSLRNFMQTVAGDEYSTSIQPESFWLSGTSLATDDNYFKWMGTGRPIVYSNWNATAEKSAKASTTSTTVSRKSCLKVGTDGVWNKENCSAKLYYVCEEPSEKLSRTFCD